MLARWIVLIVSAFKSNHVILKRPSASRGRTEAGLRRSRHTFSFGDYFDPDRMGFRTLRVINEDIVEAGGGFSMHEHHDIEIFNYVIEGELGHRDSLGNVSVIQAGNLQYISAGTGIAYSEYNNSPTEPVHFLQIWLHPIREGLPPDYAQESFSNTPPSGLTLACSADGRAGSMTINQDVELFIGRVDPKEKVSHPLGEQRHAWIQLIEGDIDLKGHNLTAGDGASIDSENEIRLRSEKGAHFLLFDLH